MQDDDEGYTVKYIARGEDSEEAGTRKKNNKKGSSYVEITIYDKEKKMLRKYKAGKIGIEEVKKYKQVMRVEVKLKNGLLNSKKFTDKKEKTLQQYYNNEMAKKYLDKYIGMILGKENFYRIDISVAMIRENKELKNNKKKKLMRLLKVINRIGYTKAEQLWTSRYNEKTFRTHLANIRELEINVLTNDIKASLRVLGIIDNDIKI